MRAFPYLKRQMPDMPVRHIPDMPLFVRESDQHIELSLAYPLEMSPDDKGDLP